MLFDISYNNIFGSVSSGKGNKSKLYKLNYIKQKTFCTVKEIINKKKRQLIECEKIFASNMSVKG